MQDFAASAGDPMSLALIKGNKFALEAGFCRLCRRPDETHFGQRQQLRLGMQDCAASAGDPMKLALVKGNYFALEAGFCRLCRRPDESRFDQRQQICLGSRILLPLPETLAVVKSKKEVVA